MPNIQKKVGKKGISYKITVSMGRDENYKQIRHYMTWTPPANMKEARADKEAAKVACQFEEKLRQGYQPDNQLTFAEYAQDFLASKQREGLKKSTYERYLLLLRRINPAIGHMRLQDIRPQHLNQFYDNLMEPNLRIKGTTASSKVAIVALLKEKKISQSALARAYGVSSATIYKLCHGGKIQWDTAVAIAKAIDMDTELLFTPHDHSEPLSNKTVLEHHRLIRTILGQAEKELIVPYNAASKATPPKAHHGEVNSLQPEDIYEILKALETESLKWRSIIHLMIVTGCRRGEIMGLKWDQIDFDHGIIHICETLLAVDSGVHTETPKTRESDRYINIPAETVSLLLQHREEQDRHRSILGDHWEDYGYVFTQEFGQPMHPDSVNGWLNKFSKRHNLPHINPHAFRHTMASILINNGTDILAVSRRLGHTNATTTLNFYGHVLREADARSSDCIANVLLRGKSTEDNE